ncbi:Ig-like domain-containing protein [Bifidobacterium oedipodis]|uniref:T9SS C-terminal target domain-containing protein n=1 Tax=Bifidobacterium oedipodis TaxID=2675322 RepID=A0A7Y0EP63_9BIFI|nr:Ig-like domain-containing protein [Bifidobacterium sp. DSM 109957]NMM93861.1 T9SS C-terminal target domain-containing protein [Bifidobacterium sp. DSM 109957]
MLIQTYYGGQGNSGGETPETKPVTGITASVSSLTVTMGSPQSFTVAIQPDDATDKTLTATSSDTGVATATISGTTVTVTPVKAGNATITVASKATPAITASVAVTVSTASVPVTSITAQPTSLEGTAGESGEVTFTVLPENATDKSLTVMGNNSRVLSVEHKAGTTYTVNYLSAGTGVVTARNTASGVDRLVNVTINAAMGIKVTPESVTIHPDQGTYTATVTVETTPSGLEWTATSSSEDYLYVTQRDESTLEVQPYNYGSFAVTIALRDYPDVKVTLPVVVQ